MRKSRRTQASSSPPSRPTTRPTFVIQKGKGHEKHEGHKQPYKRLAREEAHHVNEECSCSRSRSKSCSRSASPFSQRSRGTHDNRVSNHGKASGKIEYESDEDWADVRPQDQHKFNVQGDYRTFSAPNSHGKCQEPTQIDYHLCILYFKKQKICDRAEVPQYSTFC